MRALRASAALALVVSAFPHEAVALVGAKTLSVKGAPAFVSPVLAGSAIPNAGQHGSLPLAVVPSIPTLMTPAIAPSLIQAPALQVPAQRVDTPHAGLPVLIKLAPQGQTPDAQPAVTASAAYDGAKERPSIDAEPILTPSFEPPVQNPALDSSNGGGNGNRRDGGGRNGGGGGSDDEGGNGEEGLRPLSFPNQAQVARLQSFDPNQMLYGTLKRVRPTAARPRWAKDRPRDPSIPASSREYWAKYKPGEQVQIFSRGESVFGDRKTTITHASFKKISKLTREDLKGIFPASELRAPIAQIRKAVIDRLEEDRRVWKPTDQPVTGDQLVRVIKFKSFAQLFREENGPDAIPKAEDPKPRAPLQTTAEGPLSPLAHFLPRAVYLDVDALDGPVTPEILSDMMKLQRTGVYFVAFSRKPYDAPGGVHDRLIKRMSAYQLSILLPIRFLAVTDGGAVILEFPRGGSPKPASVATFGDAMLDVLRDAAQKSAEAGGLSPRAFAQVPQAEKPGPKSQPISLEFAVGKSVTAEQLDSWLVSFGARLSQQGLAPSVTVVEDGGRRIVRVMQAELSTSLGRVHAALGAKFGLYLNPSDLLVLSDDPALRGANPYLDMAAVTGLKGATLVENGLGLLLGEHRENVAGDLSGSASRVAQFRRDRTRYMSEFLLKQDGQEQNINFYSGHVVHAVNDWLIWSLQNGRRPTPQEYERQLRDRWDEGLRDIKPVGLPQGEDMAGWLDSRVAGALNMYREVLAAHDRGEILVGAEIPNFFMLKDRQKRTEKVKRRYTVHTIFDFVALRPDPDRPGHATLVIYDFKTGPAQSRQKLEQDVQVLTYSLFARLRWVGKLFPTPYFSGDKGYIIDDVRVEFIYNAIRQPTTITNKSLDDIRKIIVRTLNGIYAGEQQMLGTAPAKKPKKDAKAASSKKGGKGAKAAKPVKRVARKPSKP